MKFQPGQTYFTTSICDSNCVFDLTVARRTEKTITTTEGKRLGIKVHNGVECVMPLGSFSMAPTIRADRVK